MGYRIGVLIAVFVAVVNQVAYGETNALKLLAQSEATLAQAESFKIDYLASQEHISGAPELWMKGSLIVQSGNRFCLSNVGAFFFIDAGVQLVSDGTNYLGIKPREVDWERN